MASSKVTKLTIGTCFSRPTECHNCERNLVIEKSEEVRILIVGSLMLTFCASLVLMVLVSSGCVQTLHQMSSHELLRRGLPEGALEEGPQVPL